MLHFQDTKTITQIPKGEKIPYTSLPPIPPSHIGYQSERELGRYKAKNPFDTAPLSPSFVNKSKGGNKSSILVGPESIKERKIERRQYQVLSTRGHVGINKLKSFVCIYTEERERL